MLQDTTLEHTYSLAAVSSSVRRLQKCLLGEA